MEATCYSGWVRGPMTGGAWLKICCGVTQHHASLICSVYAVGCTKLLNETPQLRLLLDGEAP